MIITAKLIAIGLGLALTAFTVSTIVLAVQNSNLQDELDETREKLDLLEEALKTTSTTTTTTATPPTIASTPTVTATTWSSTPAVTQTPTTMSTTTANPEEPTDYRLPDTMKPTHYDLYLHPEIATGNFTGQLIITIQVLKATDTIILHSLYLDIGSVWLTNTGSSTIYVESKTLETKREFLILKLSETIQPRTIRLGIMFGGNMNGKIVGLYSSSYLKEDGTRKVIATSKFEPTFARQAYPCFDEPNMKATFEVTLVYPSEGGYHALSNMNIDSEVAQGMYTEVTFNRSVPMSTYLSCFIISDFISKEQMIDTKGIGAPFLMRVYATPAQIDKVDFGLEVGAASIQYYIDYFQIEYPLPKFDMVAIPDFVSGAMEHWGLVTFRETSLLFSENESSTASRQSIATTTAHEIAHMWFGNLVTMDWWNDLWLNEGFATYMANKALDVIHPGWGMVDQFIVGTVQGVLSLDATLGTHPIVQTVENPSQITEIFDTITYSKGSSIIRMLENFLTPEIFRTGVSIYLSENAYGNTKTEDFLTVIDKLVDIDVIEIMRTWTEQMGLPVVEVQQMSNTQYRLTQKRFLSNPEDYDVTHAESPFNYKWSIPISYTTSANSVVWYEWFYYDQNELIITLPAQVNWIKFNKDQVGYYRVNYPIELWENLSNTLMATPNVFSVGDRASILNDAFSLADSTQLSYSIALDMTKYLDEETDYVPWSVAASKLTSLKNKLMFTDTYTSYIAYARKLIEPVFTSVGWTPESGDENHLKNRLRTTALSAACSLGVEECLEQVSTQFNSWLDNPSMRPHADVRDTVYYYGMVQEGNEHVWDKVWNLFITETDAAEKSKLMSALSGVQVPWILSRYVDWAWNEDYVRGQDYFSCLQSIASNPIGEPIVWEYVRENWPHLVERFGLGERTLGNLIPGITSRFASQTKLEEMQYFFDKYPEAGAGTAARVRALEAVKNNIVWLDENRQKIADWLESQQIEIINL